MVKKIIAAGVGLLLVGFIAIQLVPVDRTNPPVVAEPAWDSPTTRAYAERASFDCHSNETKWPWYAYVAPISWQVADVHESREKFNISEWPSGEGDEAA
ncbi:MAG TPA: heme-binding domain-containing protein, partial [Anaerolineae bacterium]|nr:heme-binding domain-containing protein [Anaerolineae bacterium]